MWRRLEVHTRADNLRRFVKAQLRYQTQAVPIFERWRNALPTVNRCRAIRRTRFR